MKRNTPSSTQTAPLAVAKIDSANHDEWSEDDALWDLLDKASTQEPDTFFARNVVRSARQLETPTLSRRIAALFRSPKLVISAAACATILIGYQVWPSTTPSISQPSPVVAQITPVDQTTPSSDLTTDFSELVIEETLLAAAEDPTIFTRDEVVAMLGL